MLQTLFPMGTAHYLAGGLLIGLAMALLYVLTGHLGGVSTLFSSTWSYALKLRFFQQPHLLQSRSWRLMYALGLVLGGLYWWVSKGRVPVVIGLPVWKLLLSGVLLGFGARMANGCTSGHGICGLGSMQKISAVAVLIFFLTAVATANLLPWLSHALKGLK